MKLKLLDLKDYNKRTLVLEKFKFEGFQRLELLLFLVNYLKVPGKIEDYYLILGGRRLFSRHSFNNGDYFIQNARILLKTLNQKKVYLDELKEYEANNNREEKLYFREKDHFIRQKDISKEVATKEKLYLKLLSLEIVFKQKENQYAFQKGKRYGIVYDDKPIPIKPLDDIPPIRLSKPKKKKVHPISVSIPDLIKEAKEADEKTSIHGIPYREKVIKNSTFKFFNQGGLRTTSEIKMKEVVNVIGQVGAGKSTFSDALIKKLAKENKIMVVIEPSVLKVLKRYEDLLKLGIRAVPIIGSSNWTEHIHKASDGKDFLKNFDSRILTAGCALGGLIEEMDVTIDYGKEPCTKIYKYYERGKNLRNQLNMNERYTCPYYYKCPRTREQAKIFGSNVIVTTTAALSTMTIGISGMTLFQYTLEYADLVIVDEAESELQKIDKIFAPYVPYDDYIRNNGSLSWDYYRKSSDERTSTGANFKSFMHLHHESDRIFGKVNEILKRDRQGFSKSQLKRSFSGKLLIQDCKKKNKLPLELCSELEKLTNFGMDRKYLGILRDSVSIENEGQLLESFVTYDWGTAEQLSQEQVNRTIFICAILYFEYLYRELSNLVEGDTELPNSTKEILSQRFEFHQKYLPVSPIGNILGLQYKDKERNGKSDLCIIKQFAAGRTMYLRFPYLKLDEKGNPLGPHVLLLSGSSFSPGSLANHINEPVNYIIEAEQYKRDFIKDSHFEFLNTGVYVSGSGKKRNERLRELVAECKEKILDELESSNNILMVVNSYEDGIEVFHALKDVFKDTDYKEQFTYLVSDQEISNEPEKVKHSKVSGISSKKARILIAPAILIERGHNIVDNKGNAYFDTLFFMTRPMARPDDYISHVSKVNGYIMSKYSAKAELINTELFNQMRGDAFRIYNLLENDAYSLDDLDPMIQKDIVVTLFVTILQIFGRLCRIGKEEDMKSRPPKVNFADASFKAKSGRGFDLLNRLVDYLDEIINSTNMNSEVAKTLYEPFYQALKKGRRIYG